MSDSRRDRKPRQVRVEFSGGIGDIEAFRDALAGYAADNGWEITLQTDPIAFGDHGPLHRCRIGFIEGPNR